MYNVVMGMKKTDQDSLVLGLEFGSTCIKAVACDMKGNVLAKGSHRWENRLENGIWTYREDDIEYGLRACYSSLKTDFCDRFGTVPRRFACIGISGMMHGYIALARDGNLLAPFVTWRNNNAENEARLLSEALGFHIPARWSIAHLYRAVRAREPHVRDIYKITTLAGLAHYRLTGKLVLGMGEASGVFPLSAGDYDRARLAVFDGLLEEYSLPWKAEDVLPDILPAGTFAGTLTREGALWIDPAGDLQPGIPLCPPEGDAGTGMAATNSVRPHAGNVSAGTSVFVMVVADRPLCLCREEIDEVCTPSGDAVAMVHCNNCTSDINAWVSVFAEAAGREEEGMYRFLFDKALEGAPDCGGVLAYNCVSGENITHIDDGRPAVIRRSDSVLTLPNLMRAHLYSTFAALSIGMETLVREDVRADSIVAHGGMFKSSSAPQKFLAAAMNASVCVRRNAGEGGPWGMALLAAYACSCTESGENASLADWLDALFASEEGVTVQPDPVDVQGFRSFMENYRKGLPVIRSAVTALSGADKQKKFACSERIQKLKEQVWRANIDLVKNGLVIFTWGNVSAIDRESGLVVIKPSGVDYDGMGINDMVVVDMDGNVVDGKYRPSSDTPTHLELYKAHPEIGAVVHTHSSHATAFAQSGRDLPAYGTTHADYFHGSVPCTRPLTPEEIAGDYEKNTGIVINETVAKDAMEVPAVLVSGHGPFAWGKDADQAVYNATVLEEVAKTAWITEQLNPQARQAPQCLMDKHYYRKHGKNAYYGQNKN